MKRSQVGWIAALLTLGVTGCGVVTTTVKGQVPVSDIVLSAPTLAQGYLQKVSPAWWRKVEQLKVLNAQGQAVNIPADRPLLFFAWWCPHCHAVLKQLQREGVMQHVTLVSMYVNAMPEKGSPEVIHSVHDAQRVTEQSLATLGIHLPARHLFYLMPGPSQNGLQIGVPTWMEHTQHGWYALNGAPSDGAMWPTILQNATNN